jgi:hypothetical protein
MAGLEAEPRALSNISHKLTALCCCGMRGKMCEWQMRAHSAVSLHNPLAQRKAAHGSTRQMCQKAWPGALQLALLLL